MVQIELSELETLIVGLVALLAGTHLRRRVPLLKRIAVPNAVVGAAIVAVIALLLNGNFKIDITFAIQLRDVMLLVFFATIGLAAKLTMGNQSGLRIARWRAVIHWRVWNSARMGRGG